MLFLLLLEMVWIFQLRHSLSWINVRWFVLWRRRVLDLRKRYQTKYILRGLIRFIYCLQLLLWFLLVLCMIMVTLVRNGRSDMIVINILVLILWHMHSLSKIISEFITLRCDFLNFSNETLLLGIFIRLIGMFLPISYEIILQNVNLNCSFLIIIELERSELFFGIPQCL